MEDHYLTEQHQNALIKVVRQILSQLNDRQMDVDLPRTTTAGTCNPAIAQLEELDEMLNILVSGIEALTNDEQRLTHEALHMQITLSTLAAELSKVKDIFWFNFLVNAQSERLTSIYSPPFYSSPNGYKMRACLYLNGNGNARCIHMSLFFVLMRDLNDPILKFPFNYKVTFCLYGQIPQQRHIIDSFRPGIKSNSFQSP
ncbi:unnamed protein product [Rotaria sp. Silwood1]|nr:unnamed protein product [Rotaria sp. Silwood1]CAF5005604.1 unnamed protein product [Rotaria sp. Silwood1]